MTSTTKNKLVPSFYLSAGVSYTFKNMFSKWKKHTSQKVSTQEFNQMNEQINEMRKQINNLQEELENAKVVNSNQRIILEPMREMPSVAVLFDAMGSSLSYEELEKLQDIGTWMQDHPNSITIVPFADSQAQDAAVQQVKDMRVAAIRKVLTEQFGIDNKRILVSTPEKMGYINKTGQEALIIFMTE